MFYKRIRFCTLYQLYYNIFIISIPITNFSDHPKVRIFLYAESYISINTSRKACEYTEKDADKMTEFTQNHSSYTDGGKAILDYSSPLDYKALMNTLQCFSDRYPFTQITYMGTSILGRGIPMVTLGSGGAKCRSVLYVGCHHGMEWITSILLLRFINEYCEELKHGRRIYNINIKKMFRSRTIHVIPQLNVDGADIQINGSGECILKDRLISMNGGEDFTNWQANARGVDLNHNYDAGFYEYKKIEAELGIDGGCATRFSGEAPESEPEIASITSLLRFSNEISSVLTLHTQGEEIYCSSGDVYPPRSRGIARLMSSMTGYKVAMPEGTACYGGLTDWYIRKMHRPSFTVECGKGVNPLPLESYEEIYERLREMLFTLPLLV